MQSNLPTTQSLESNSAESISPGEQNRMYARLKENPWFFLHPYNAVYEIASDGEKLGKATRRLKRQNNQWELEISSKLKKWLLSLKSKETSAFIIKNKQLQTTHFLTSTKISFKSPRMVEQNFDWQKQIETGKKGEQFWELPLQDQLFDRMSHILQLRADLLTHQPTFKYLISYKGRRKIYEYAKTAKESLQTPMGTYEAIRMDRISGDDSNFSIWLCPELNYFPIKIAQFEQDKPDVILTLSQLSVLP
ncbi:DUF3108 domain-containing protein [Aliikangiella maris]|uniref:DUF3108 domain-containing protein n=2 Tax=Aliikangiella maris TaxID=3162458 RepID=A0ABV2BNZ7_9GAMM